LFSTCGRFRYESVYFFDFAVMLFTSRRAAEALNLFRFCGYGESEIGCHSGNAPWAFEAIVASMLNGTGPVTTKSGARWLKSIAHAKPLSKACRYSSQKELLKVVWNSRPNLPSRSTNPSAHCWSTAVSCGLLAVVIARKFGWNLSGGTIGVK